MADSCQYRPIADKTAKIKKNRVSNLSIGGMKYHVLLISLVI
jgi:hypothetical protein